MVSNRFVSIFLAILASTEFASTAPNFGMYYNGTGNSSGFCPIATCPNCTNPWQYNSGCNFNVSMVCTNCTNPLPPWSYYSATGGLNNTCAYSSCQKCSAGYQNLGCSNTSQGSCTQCTGLLPGNYWVVSNGYTCSQAACPPSTLAPGQYYINSTNPLAYCPTATCGVTCPVGQYAQGCGGTSNGTCAPCLNTLPNGLTYNSTGGSTGQCPINGCLQLCGAGQYLSGCGGATSCLPCTNSQPNVNYYIQGTAYSSTTCPTAGCTSSNCYNGFYLQGCGGTSSGTCTQCGNAAWP